MGGDSYVRLLAEPGQKNGGGSGGVAAALCDYIERGILWWCDDYSSKKHNYWVKGPYAPANETDPKTDLPIVGTIPVSNSMLSSI